MTDNPTTTAPDAAAPDNAASGAGTGPAGLADRLVALEAWREEFLADLDAVQDREEAVIADPPELHPDDEVLDPDRLIGWVHRHVTAVIARPLRGEVCWCPLWWEHPEAVFRFEAARRAWTHLAPEPGPSMSTWIRDHLDPCLRELLSPLGPFADCSHSDRFRGHSEHTPLPTLPTQVPTYLPDE
jgi:hypothetical protein